MFLKRFLKKNQFHILFIFCFSLNNLFSDTVILIHEEVIRGKVISQDANTLKMTDEKGKDKIFSKTEILKVVYRDVTDQKELDKIIKEEKEKKGIKSTKKEEPRNKMQIIWRSAALPGWGLWKADKKLLAILVLGTIVGAGLYAAERTQSFYSSQDSYDSQTRFIGSYALFKVQDNENVLGTETKRTSNTEKGFWIVYNSINSRSSYEPVENAASFANNALITMGVVYIAQLGYAYYLGRKWEKEGPSKTAISPSGKVLDIGWNFDVKQKNSENQIGSKENSFDINYVYSF